MRLGGKVALVTGSSPNIGGTLASAFAAEGAKVACNDLRTDVAEARASKICAEGGEAVAVAADVTDPAAVARFADDVLAR